MINFAHRGASQYAPENTMASFRLGLEQGANGIETDVQKTKDDVLVLFHDSNMKRIFGLDASISDFTFDELNRLDAGAFFAEEYKGERIVRLEDFLKEYGNKDIHLAIEIKQAGIEKETLDMVRRYVKDGNFTITSFLFDSIENLSKVEEKPSLGYLTRDYSEDLLDRLVAMGVEEYCPCADSLTPDIVATTNSKGLRVRAWGVKTPELMDKMVNMGVYGMTVNFPDLLTQRLNSGKR